MAITRFSSSNITTGNKKYASFDTGYPTIMAAPTATDLSTGTSVSVAFTAQTGATSYTAISSPGSITGTGTSSPITVSGLTTGTAYTFQIRANNAVGSGPYSAASNSVTPINPASFESISTQFGTGTAAQDIIFSSIPQTYKHLQVRLIARSTSGGTGVGGGYIRMNGDTAGNYTLHGITGNGAAFNNTAQISQPFMQLPNTQPYSGTPAGFMGVMIMDILDYTNSSKYKVCRYHIGSARDSQGQSNIMGGVWLSNSAITQLNFVPDTGWSTNTVIALYGIKEMS